MCATDQNIGDVPINFFKINSERLQKAVFTQTSLTYLVLTATFCLPIRSY